jgi:uncharacterized protein
MLVIDVRSLAAHAARVVGALEVGDAIWMAHDTVPDTGIHVTGRVSAAGRDRFYFHGQLMGVTTQDCRRCLRPVATKVDADVVAVFSEADDEDAGDPDVYPLSDSGTMVDLRPAIREQWLLNVPSFVLCRPDCRGLCANCGADWNTGRCEHMPASDRHREPPRAPRARDLRALSNTEHGSSQETHVQAQEARA